jgi:hypothetical protein
MTTWTSRISTALGITLMLSACDGPGAPGGVIGSLKPPQNAALPPAPLRQAKMMRGAVTLVPPGGYCIDPVSLSQSFAIMARCDILGAPTGGSGAPIGVLTVSFARSASDATLPTAQTLAAAGLLSSPTQTRQSPATIVFQTTGSPPSSDLSPTHWRSVTLVGPLMMGAALFGPEGRRAVSEEGAGVLEEMIRLTTEKTIGG